MKIALGTVQFGMLYGIANKNGQVAKKSVRKILSHAKKNGINTVDTAISYGDSEEFLGNAGIKEWDLVTKLPEVPKLCTNISDWVNDKITGALKRLRVDRVKALMLHRPEPLLGTDGGDLWHAIKELKNRGIVKKIGFSIYGPEELEQLWMRYRPDIIQAPFNIFDQRLKTSGWLEKLHNNNVEIHVRSIFLQGLLLMNKDDRPEEFNRWNFLWEIWEKWLKKESLTPLEACIKFINSESFIDYAVVGVDNLYQLKQITRISGSLIDAYPKELSVIDEDLINPSHWRKTLKL